MRIIIYARKINQEIYECEKEITISIHFEMHLPKWIKWKYLGALSIAIRAFKEAISNEKIDSWKSLMYHDEEAKAGIFKRGVGKLEEFKLKNGYDEFMRTHPEIAQQCFKAQLNYPSTNAKP